MSIPEELLQEWDYTRNSKPSYYIRASRKKVSWICKNNMCGCHVWETTINSRILGDDCPYCSGVKVCIHSSLLSTHPVLCREWSPQNIISPISVKANSHRKVLWKCARHHTWITTIYSRTVEGYGCFECKQIDSKPRTVADTEFIHEWDHVKNKVSPDRVTINDTTLLNWVCKNKANGASEANGVGRVGNVCGCHKWQASAYHRNAGKGCPYCSGIKTCKHTSLVYTHTQLAKEWDTQKNTLTPDRVQSTSLYNASWVCASGVCGCHKWKDTVVNRANGAGCPYCEGIVSCPHSVSMDGVFWDCGIDEYPYVCDRCGTPQIWAIGPDSICSMCRMDTVYV